MRNVLESRLRVAALTVLMANGWDLMNTAIERICDLIDAGPDERIRHVQSFGADAVGLCFVVWIAVIALGLVRVGPQFMAV